MHAATTVAAVAVGGVFRMSPLIGSLRVSENPKKDPNTDSKQCDPESKALAKRLLTSPNPKLQTL